MRNDVAFCNNESAGSTLNPGTVTPFLIDGTGHDHKEEITGNHFSSVTLPPPSPSPPPLPTVHNEETDSGKLIADDGHTVAQFN